MAYRVFWMIENHIFCTRFSANVLLEDIQQATVEISDYLDAAYANAPENRIIGVIDMQEANISSLLPLTVSVLVNKIADVIDPRIWQAKPGLTVLVTTADRARLVISLVIKLSAQPMTTVGTMDGALAIISAMYPELEQQITDYKTSRAANT